MVSTKQLSCIDLFRVQYSGMVSNEHKKIKKNQNDMRPTPNVVICDIVARKKYKHGLWIIDRKWFPQNSYLV